MRYFYIIVLVFYGSMAFGQQPPICGNDPAMTSFCTEACIICDIDGFTGRNNSNIQGQAPPGFCTTEVHHMQWIGFIAGTTNLTLEVKVSNCSRNQGLEIGLYEGIGCQNYRKISDCDTDVRPGETRVFSNIVPLVIGQYYYFVMDGSANDICDWTIKVTAGSTIVAPLETAPEVFIPDVVCQDESFEIKTNGLVGATYYSWSIDGAFTKAATAFTHSLDKPGTYKVCLDASNVCDQAPQTCKDVLVLSSPKTTIQEEMCFGECFSYLGKDYCQSGTYEIVLAASNGCDSTITLNLQIKDKITATNQLKICEGDTISIGDGKFYTQGIHTAIIQNQEGCNIFMTLDITVIICNIQSDIEVTPVVCNGENTGSLKFMVGAGTPPFTYTGYKVENATTTFSGSIANINEWIIIKNLDEGNYNITILDGFGNSKIINDFVPQPSKLESMASVSSYHSFGVSCRDGEDGYIKIIPNGGVSPYTYAHDFSTSKMDSVGMLRAGTYSTTITDVNGCKTTLVNTITEPEKLSVSTIIIDPGCDGPTTGEYTIASATGGTLPYTYTLNNEDIEAKVPKKSLAEGIYTLKLVDANGCELIARDTLVAAIIPKISVLNEAVQVGLGDSITLRSECNEQLRSIIWVPNEHMACDTCLSTSVLPLQDTKYVITVVSKDGCSDTAAVDVRVSKNRSFVISNVITPDGNGVNDKIRYVAGKDVAVIDYIRIYDRWGNLVYNGVNILPTGVTDLDWDARFQGRAVLSGVYVWMANVTYIDGDKVQYKGSLTILL